MRFLLDTGLLLLTLVRGRLLLHAGAVLVDGSAVGLLGPSGSGKTTTLAELVRAGHPLVCDDVLAVEQGDDAAPGGRSEPGARDDRDESRLGERWIAHPGPPVMNLPRAWPPGVAALGRELADFGAEAWVAVRDAVAEPAPLGALVLLERRPGAADAATTLPATVLDLLPHALGLDATEPAVQALLFTRVSDLVGATPIVRLSCDTATPPAAVAALVGAAVAAARGRVP